MRHNVASIFSESDVIIFDFDGVLVESLDIKSNAFFQLYQPYGIKIANEVVHYHKDNMGISRFEKFRYFQKKYFGSELTSEQEESLADQFSDIVSKAVILSDPVLGSLQFLEKNKNKDLFIVSATPETELKTIVEKRKLIPYMKGIYGSPKNKIENIEKILKEHQHDSKKVVMIGDAMEDYKSAEKTNINFILRETHCNQDILLDFKIRIKNFLDYI